MSTPRSPPAESSSTTRVARPLEQPRRGGAPGAVGHATRRSGSAPAAGGRPRRRGWRGRRRGRRGRAPRRPPATPTTSAPTDSSRSSSGGKHGFSTTTRSPKRSERARDEVQASMAPSTTVSSSAAYGQSSRSSVSRSSGEHRVVEVAAGCAGRRSASRRALARLGSSAASGTPVDRSRSKSVWRSQGLRVAPSRRVGAGRSTVVPRRPSVRMVPERASSAQAALTVVGESASSAATGRIGGSRSPGGSVPSRMAARDGVRQALGGGLVEALLDRGEKRAHTL